MSGSQKLAFLPGEFDQWTSARHGIGQRGIARIRDMCWARVARAETDLLHCRDRYQGAEWQSLDKKLQCAYIEGRRRPQVKLVRRVALSAPESERVRASRLWVVLDPRTDLHQCSQVARTFELSAGTADFVADVLGAGGFEDLVRIATSFETLTQLVAGIRLAKGAHDDARAFKLGQGLLRMMGFVAAHSLYSSCCEPLSAVIGKLVLDGLDDGMIEIHVRPETFAALQELLEERLNSVTMLCGGISRMARGPWLSASTRVDVVRPFAQQLGNPMPGFQLSEMFELPVRAEYQALNKMARHQSALQELESHHPIIAHPVRRTALSAWP